MSVKTTVTLLIFCFDELSIDLNVVLNFPTIIAFLSVNSCLMHLAGSMLGAFIFTSVTSCDCTDPFIIM